MGRPCARRSNWIPPAHPPGTPIERIMARCGGVRRCAGAIRDRPGLRNSQCLTHIVTTFCIRKYALCLTRVGLRSEVIY
jgi:hypothetical protein